MFSYTAIPNTVVEGLWGLVRVRFCGRLQESAFMFIYIYVIGLLHSLLGCRPCCLVLVTPDVPDPLYSSSCETHGEVCLQVTPRAMGSR